MRLIRFALLSAVVWAGLGTSPARAQFFQPGFGNPFMPLGGFGMNSARFGFRSSYGFNVSSNGVNFGFNYRTYNYGGYASTYPLSPFYGLNPYTYAALASYNTGSYMQGGVGAYSAPPVNRSGGDYGNGGQGVFNEWKFEREKGPRAEDRRAAATQALLDRSLNQPAESDIASGAALNAVLNAIEGARAKLKDVPAVAIPEDTLPHINYSKGTTSASPALLADDGQVAWPRALQTLAAADDVRKQIGQRFADAYRQAAAGKKIDAATLKDLDGFSKQLETIIGENVSKFGFQEHRDAKRFVKLLDDAIAFLRMPDAGQWLPGKSNIVAKSVQDLVKAMSEKAAKFAPATPGQERAYVLLHRALVDYYRQSVPQVAAATN